MKYKVGDKIRIKTWKQMAEEFPIGIGSNARNVTGWGAGDYINCKYVYTVEMEEDLQEISPNRILTIGEAEEPNRNFCYTYMMEEISWNWSDDMIEGLAEDIDDNVVDNDISYRFELIDFD